MKNPLSAPLCAPRFAALLVFTAHWCVPISAADQYWNVDGTGGSGNWSNGPADKNWNTSLGAITPNYAWPDTGSETAVFASPAGGSILVFGDVQTAGLKVTGAGYDFQGGSIHLDGPVPFIQVDAGSLGIGATLAGAAGFQKTGAGTLVLSGINSLSGAVTVSGGTLQLGLDEAFGSPGAVSLAVQSGAMLDLGSYNQTVSGFSSNGLVSGSGLLTSTGGYLLGGGSVISGNLGTGLMQVSGGLSTISGTSQASSVTINSDGTLKITGNNLSDSATVTILGTLDAEGNDTVGSLIISGGTLSGSGVMSAATYTLENGGSVTGHLGDGAVMAIGDSSLSGSSGSGAWTIESGTMSFTGASQATSILINGSGTLIDGGSFSATPSILNEGTLRMDVSSTFSSYVSQGGTLSGTGVLTAATYDLQDGSTVSGKLGAGALTSEGSVLNSGSIGADEILVKSGVLTNTGVLGTSSSHIDLAAGSRLIAQGTENFGSLTTSGSGIATWTGNLNSHGNVSPGGGGFGGLAVTGDFNALSGSTLSIGLSASNHDLISVSGAANLGGTLDLHQVGPDQIALMIPVKIISAGSYSSNFTSITEDLDGEVFFNPLTGDVTRLVFSGSNSVLRGATRNQAAAWLSLYDDVIDPGVRNVTAQPGALPPFSVTGGIADTSHPGLLAALGASITPEGLSRNVLDRLSPEVYASFSDYSIQATRAYQRSALTTEGFGLAPSPASRPHDAKGGELAAPAWNPGLQWEVFAAANSFSVETSSSIDHADYRLSSDGGLAGVRAQIGDRYRVTGYVAGDDGRIRGSLIDGDGNGWSTGLLGEALLEKSHAIKLTAGVSYGTYSFDGRRSTIGAVGGGVLPDSSFFSSVDSSAWDLSLGLEGAAYQNSRFRLIPEIDLHYSHGSSNAFKEAAKVDTVALAVADVRQDAFLADAGLRAEFDLTPRIMLTAEAGASADLDDQPVDIGARFVGGSRGFMAQADGLSDNMLHFGLSADWKATDRIGVRLGYRAEFRDGADMLNEVNLATRFRF